MSTLTQAAEAPQTRADNAINLLLRDPAGVARRCRQEDGLKALVIASVLTILVGGAIFGAMVGSFRGGLQIPFGGLKTPLAMMATLVLVVPALHGIAAAMGRPLALRSVIALCVTAAGRAALVLVATAPILWLMIDLHSSYHQTVLATALAYGIAGAAGLGIILRGLGQGIRGLLISVIFTALSLGAAGQAGWTLRPYLGRPQTVEVPFLREDRGSFADSLYRSTRSSLNIYDRRTQDIRVRMSTSVHRVVEGDHEYSEDPGNTRRLHPGRTSQ